MIKLQLDKPRNNAVSMETEVDKGSRENEEVSVAVLQCRDTCADHVCARSILLS